MTQRDRHRLVALKKAKKGAITQRQAAEEIGQTERHVRRLKQLKANGDKAVVPAGPAIESEGGGKGPPNRAGDTRPFTTYTNSGTSPAMYPRCFWSQPCFGSCLPQASRGKVVYQSSRIHLHRLSEVQSFVAAPGSTP